MLVGDLVGSVATVHIILVHAIWMLRLDVLTQQHPLVPMQHLDNTTPLNILCLHFDCKFGCRPAVPNLAQAYAAVKPGLWCSIVAVCPSHSVR